jgi:transcriptional regulator with XRE-family HTH domain
MKRAHPLKEFRERQTPPLRQDQLADLLGVSKASVSRWESGARKVDRELLSKVAVRTGIAPSELRPDIADLMKPQEAAE